MSKRPIRQRPRPLRSRAFMARYEGICPMCRNPWRQGALICSLTWQGSRTYVHADCESAKQAADLREQEVENSWVRSTLPGWKDDPKGTARVDHLRPCQGCSEPILSGQSVRQVNGVWWHEECRRRFRQGLGMVT